MVTGVYYEVGYRLNADVAKSGRFSTPYFEFCHAPTIEAANEVYNKMRRDFPTAEFRVLEVRGGSCQERL